MASLSATNSHPTAEVSQSSSLVTHAIEMASLSATNSHPTAEVSQSSSSVTHAIEGASSVVSSSSVIKIYPWINYKVSKKYIAPLSQPIPKSVTDDTGMKVTVEAVILTEIDGSPAVLLLQEAPEKRWMLPGAVLKAGDSEIEGLKQALTSMLLSPVVASEFDDLNVYNWEVGECLARFWGTRHFILDTYVPYAMKDCQLLKSLYLVRLPAWMHFFIPILSELKPFKLEEIHGNNDEEKYQFDPLVADVPLLVSKFTMSSSTNTN